MHIADRLHARKWGVFHHYLYGLQNNPALPNNQGAGETDWQTCTQALDVRRIADTLHDIGAGYYFITVMQGRKYMIAENSVYRGIVGDEVADECLSRRDLIAELCRELDRYGIDLYLYFTGDGPYQDEEIGRLFGFTEPREQVTVAFTEKWAAVLGEYSRRYRGKARGWWLDGMYRRRFGYTNELMEPYYRAIKAGDPDSLTAFNDGVRPFLYRQYPEEEFTTGEQVDLSVVPSSRFCDGAQAHILLPLGTDSSGIGATWASGGLHFPQQEICDYADKVTSAGGVVTFDCMLNRDGSFDPEQAEALRAVGRRLSRT